MFWLWGLAVILNSVCPTAVVLGDYVNFLLFLNVD